MKNISAAKICDVIQGRSVSGKMESMCNSVSIDSRKTNSETLFFAIVGEINDGHDFLGDVFESGCTTVVISNEDKIPQLLRENKIDIIVVNNTLVALQSLATYYLDTLNAKKIAVTGSVGKTTCRDLIATVAGSKYKTCRTQGNLNNVYGVPLSVLSFDEDVEVAVIEFGIDKVGGMDVLVDIVKPDIAVVTNIGISHLNSFGNRDNIRSEKLKVAKHFTSENVLIINRLSDMLNMEKSETYKIVTACSQDSEFSIDQCIDYGIEGIDFSITYNNKSYIIKMDVPGIHNSINATLAIAVGVQLGIDIDTAIESLKDLTLTSKRMEVYIGDSVRIIDDTYNAAPQSMIAAIDTLVNSSSERRVAILGDMYELGYDEIKYHNEVGRYLGKSNLEVLISIGNLGHHIAISAKEINSKLVTYSFDTPEDAIEKIESIIKDGDLILLKGSRGIRIDKISEYIKKVKKCK